MELSGTFKNQVPVHWEAGCTGTRHKQTYPHAHMTVTATAISQPKLIACRVLVSTLLSYWCLIYCQQGRKWETFTLAGPNTPCSLVASSYFQPPLPFSLPVQWLATCFIACLIWEQTISLYTLFWVVGEASHQTSSREMVTFFLQWQESSLRSQLNTPPVFGLVRCYDSPVTNFQFLLRILSIFLEGEQKKRFLLQ